jgi:hypothetical protein
MPNLRRHLSFANVASLAAIVIATSGTSYAAATLAHNSVGSAQIKPGGVATQDLHGNAVTSAKVKNGSLLAQDFKAGQLPAGAAGPPGPAGDPGVVGTVVVRRVDIVLPAGAGAGMAGAITSGFATCEPGETIIGGSANIGNVTDPAVQELLATRPSLDNVGSGTVPASGGPFAFWKGTARTLTNTAGSMRVFAICAQQ